MSLGIHMDICSSRRGVAGERLSSSSPRRATMPSEFVDCHSFADPCEIPCPVRTFALVHLGARARVCFLIKEKKASNVALFDLLVVVVVVVSVKAGSSRRDRKEKNKKEMVRSSFVHLLTA